MAQTLLNSAIAISGATASGSTMPYPANIIAIISGVAAVVAQIATSTAAIKKAKSAYAEGTDYHRGGSAIIGEKMVKGQWQPEVVQTPNNKLFVVDKPTYFDRLPIGTSVTPLPEFNSWDYGINVGYGDLAAKWEENNELLRQIVRKPTVTIDVNDKITSYIYTKNSRSKILNARFNA